MNFDAVAPWYAFLERVALGRTLDRARQAFLPAPPVRSVLIVGEGPGAFLIPFLKHGAPRGTPVLIDVVEPSSEMQKLMLAQFHQAYPSAIPIPLSDHPANANQSWLLPRPYDTVVHFHHSLIEDYCARPADTATSNQPSRYDLIVTQFFFDNFDRRQCQQLVQGLHKLAGPEAVWWLADFVGEQRTQNLLRWRQTTWLAAMRLFFRVTAGVRTHELVNAPDLLAPLGWLTTRRQTFAANLVEAVELKRHSSESRAKPIPLAKNQSSDTFSKNRK